MKMGIVLGNCFKMQMLRSQENKTKENKTQTQTCIIGLHGQLPLQEVAKMVQMVT